MLRSHQQLVFQDFQKSVVAEAWVKSDRPRRDAEAMP
jgi:hypothetical protein